MSSYTMTKESLVIVIKGKTHTLNKNSLNFDKARKAAFEERWDDISDLISVGKGIEQWANGHFSYKDSKIFFRGDLIPSDLTERIIGTASEGHNPTFLMKFWEKLQENPSNRSVTQLYPFLAHKGIPIDEDGDILAYKAIRADYTDCYSGTVVNKPGTVNKMPRNKISDDPNKGCHFGFHVGALKYAKSFGGPESRVVICKVNPAHVVCVPYDSSHQKMRICEYKVIGHYGSRLPNTVHVEDVESIPLEKVETVEVESIIQVPDSPASNHPWDEFDKMDSIELVKQHIGPLRKYARHRLQIIGASKIPGGKVTLVERIMEVRRK